MTEDAETATTRLVNRDNRATFAALALMLALGAGATIVFALASDTGQASVLAVGSAVAGAALLVGGVAGFLFGIPRRLQQDSKSSGGDEHRLYSANTNLEQISDWLTKILVGVGLTQIGHFGDLLRWIAETASPGLGGTPASRVFAVAICVYSSIAGFLTVYLWTSLFLGRALTNAERVSLLRKQLTQLEAEAQADASALALAHKQLNVEEKAPPEVELGTAIASASKHTRSHVYFRAQIQREENWKDSATKPEMERTIPLFRALVAADPDRRFHSSLGQLGFALKDQRKPQWEEAERILTHAINARGKALEEGHRAYEFNRAICRINLDAAHSRNERSSEKDRNEILADLAMAHTAKKIRRWFQDSPDVVRWMEHNGIESDHVRQLASQMTDSNPPSKKDD